MSEEAIRYVLAGLAIWIGIAMPLGVLVGTVFKTLRSPNEVLEDEIHHVIDISELERQQELPSRDGSARRR